MKFVHFWIFTVKFKQIHTYPFIQFNGLKSNEKFLEKKYCQEKHFCQKKSLKIFFKIFQSLEMF